MGGSNTDLGFNVYALDRASKTFLDLAAKVDLLGRKLDQVDRKRVNVNVDVDTARAQSQLSAFAARLDAADSRMANLVQSGLALAPALVPIGATAVPALAGLTTQLGFAVAGAGTAVLAFSGVGDALDALNDYHLEPTSKNFEKLQEKMDTLGPAGQEFVLFLQNLRPELQGLQDLAQQGLLPGAQDSITELLELMPQAESMIAHISTTMGSLLAEAGDNLNDPRWVDFFEFLDREANPTLTAMGKSLGNFVEGTANMIVAFNPLADDFTTGMLNMSRSFREWTAGLEGSDSFQEFTDYVRESGPAALDALGSIAGALIELVEAAAPVGRLVLPVIEGLADGLAAVADSPAGPVLISIGAAIGVVGRSLALLRAVGLRGDNKSVIGEMFSGAVKPIKDSATALTTVTTAQDRATRSVKDHEIAERKRAQTLRSGATQIGKFGALVGGFALAQSGLAEKTGLSNTASMALMGTIAGPWGAAIGGGIGLAMDFAAVNNDLEDSLKRVNRAAEDPSDLAGSRAALDDMRASLQEYVTTVERVRSGQSGFWDLKDQWTSLTDTFTNSGEEMSEAYAKANGEALALKGSWQSLYNAVEGEDPFWGPTRSLEELSDFAVDAGPVLQRLGYDIRELKPNTDEFREAQAAIRDYFAEMDTASGKSRAVGEALAELASQMESNVTQAEALKNAMDTLFGVQLSQAEATDAWISGLQELRKQIADTNGALQGNSEAALANREQIRSSVDDLRERVAADAAANVSGRELAATLLQGRDAIINQATAAGASRREVEDYLDTLGMTPENLATIITTPGLMTAKQQIHALGRLYELTPKQVRTLIQQAGMDASQAEIRRLARLYDLTPKQVRTLLDAQDRASSVIGRVEDRLWDLNGDEATVTITTIQRTLNTVQQGARSLFGLGNADGSVVDFFANGGLPENHVAQIAPAGAWRVWAEPETGGEAYIPLAESKRPRSRRIAEETVGRLGGAVEWFAKGGLRGLNVEQRLDVLNLQQQINQLRHDLAATGKDALKPIARAIAEAELEVAKRDLRRARNAPAREAREALRGERAGLRETRAGLRAARGGYDLDPEMTAAEVRAEVADFRREVRDAGGEWTKGMQRAAERAIRHAAAIDRARSAIEAETQLREQLQTELDEQTRSMEQLRATMDQFGGAVASNFLSSPFNLSLDAPALGAGGPVDPNLAAARANLADAQGRYRAVLGTDMDRLQRSYEASRILAEVDQYQAQVDELERAQRSAGGFADETQRAVTGLEAFEQAVTKNTAAAEDFLDDLEALRAKGISDAFFEALAKSGDTLLADQLAGLSGDQIGYYDDLYQRNLDSAAEVAAFAVQEIYGRDQAALQRTMDDLSQQIARSTARTDHQTAVIDRRSESLEATNQRGFDQVGRQLETVGAQLAAIPREMTNTRRTGKGKGRA